MNLYRRISLEDLRRQRREEKISEKRVVKIGNHNPIALNIV